MAVLAVGRGAAKDAGPARSRRLKQGHPLFWNSGISSTTLLIRGFVLQNMILGSIYNMAFTEKNV